MTSQFSSTLNNATVNGATVIIINMFVSENGCLIIYHSLHIDFHFFLFLFYQIFLEMLIAN